LKNLTSLPGPSGYEAPIAEAVKKIWSGLVDETSVSRLGNLYALKRANTAISGKKRSVLFAAHMDAVGMIVTELVEEFIRFEEIGGLDPRILPGQFVDIHGRNGAVKGLIVMPGRSLTKEDHGKDPIPMQELLIDTGLEAEELKKYVRPGDVISFANEPVCMQDDTFSGHTLDDRASIAALTICLQELQTVLHKWDVYAVGTVMEEESMAGGKTAPYDLHPDIAVAVDVTHASSPVVKGWYTYELGGGPVLTYGMNVQPMLHDIFKEVCEAERIPYAVGYSPQMSGTDAIEMQIASSGIPAMVVSIPLRYMHTANELVSLKDIQNVGKLLAAFVRKLDENTMDRLVWED
jgi:endoglucanase